MNSQHPKRVEDYTTANIVLISVNLFWILGVVWANFGFAPAVILALVVNHGLGRIEQARGRRISTFGRG